MHGHGKQHRLAYELPMHRLHCHLMAAWVVGHAGWSGSEPWSSPSHSRQLSSHQPIIHGHVAQHAAAQQPPPPAHLRCVPLLSRWLMTSSPVDSSSVASSL